MIHATDSHGYEGIIGLRQGIRTSEREIFFRIHADPSSDLSRTKFMCSDEESRYLPKLEEYGIREKVEKYDVYTSTTMLESFDVPVFRDVSAACMSYYSVPFSAIVMVIERTTSRVVYAHPEYEAQILLLQNKILKESPNTSHHHLGG